MEEGHITFSNEDLSTTVSTPQLQQDWNNIFSASRLFYIAELVEHYYTPLLCLVGTIGNCLSVAVFCFNATQRNLSSSYYLSALAFADTGFLVTLFILWGETLRPGILVSEVGCPVIMYAGQVTTFLSVWLTVAFTVERFFAVCSPLRRSSICTVSKARKVIAGLTTFALIIFSYALFIARVEVYRGPDSNYGHDKSVPYSASPFPNATKTGEENTIFQQMLPPLKENGNTSAGCFEGKCLSQIFQKDGTTLLPFENSWSVDDASHLANEESSNTTPSFPRVDSDVQQGQYMFNSTSPNHGYGKGKVAYMCTVPMKYITISIIANYLDSIITLIIPFCLISYFNMRIAICVWKLKDERRRIVAGSLHNNFNQGSKSQPTRQSTMLRMSGYMRRIMRSPAATKRRTESQELHPLGQLNQYDPSIPPNQSANRYCLSSIDEQHSKEGVSEGNQDLRRDEDTNEEGGCKSVSKESPMNADKHRQSTKRCFPSSKFVSNLNNGDGQSLRFPSNPIIVQDGSVRSNLTLSGTSSLPPTNSSHSSERRVTKMLLLVSTVFLLLNLPSHAIRGVTFLQSLLWSNNIEVLRRLHAAQQLSNVLLFNTNFAVNFFLYCLSGRNFRKSLWNVLFGRCGKKSTRSPRARANITLRKTVQSNERNLGEMGNRVKEDSVPPEPFQPTKIRKFNVNNDLETIELEMSN